MTANITDGVINLYKPPGITSAKALYRVRKITGVKKSGHTGTLDPDAEGVLVLCLGKATKLVEKVMSLVKVYRAEARLDVTSPTLDLEGELTPVDVAAIPDANRIAQEITTFEGAIQQVPPQISAIKVGGVAAYKLTRSGKPPTLQPREVHVHWLHLHRYDWPNIDFEMACGRGTYVRSLVRDLGERLGVGGCLTHLTRTAVGPFNLASALDFKSLETRDPSTYILPLTRVATLLEQEAGRVPARPLAQGAS